MQIFEIKCYFCDKHDIQVTERRTYVSRATFNKAFIAERSVKNITPSVTGRKPEPFRHRSTMDGTISIELQIVKTALYYEVALKTLQHGCVPR